MLHQTKSRHFLKKDLKYPLSEETFLDVLVQDPSDHVDLFLQNGFANGFPNKTCPSESGPLAYVPNAVTQELSEPPPPTSLLQQTWTPDNDNTPAVGISTKAFPAERGPCHQRETPQYVPLSPNPVVISFENGKDLGLCSHLAIDLLFLDRFPSLRTLDDYFYPKKQDSRERMAVLLPSLPPLCLEATYTFSLAPYTGLHLELRIPNPNRRLISYTDSPRGRYLCLTVVLEAPTVVSTLATYSFVEVDSELSQVWREQQLPLPPSSTSIFCGVSQRSPLAKPAKPSGSAVVDSRYAATRGLDVDTSSLLPTCSSLKPTGRVDPNDGGNDQVLTLHNMVPCSALESVPLLENPKQQHPFGKAFADHHPLVWHHPNAGPSFRLSPSPTALGKRRRSEDGQNTCPSPRQSPSKPSLEYFDYDQEDEDGGSDTGSDADSDENSDPDDEGNDGHPDDHFDSSVLGHDHAYMWRKLGVKEIGCSYGWIPWTGVNFLVPCTNTYNRTSNCTSHYKRVHLNGGLRITCGIKICKDQPKQTAQWKARGRLYYTCEDMGCLSQCDNPCQNSFATTESLHRHRNKHSLDKWLKCLHSDQCQLTFENSDLRSKHHSLCFPNCPKQGQSCTHHRSKSKKSCRKKPQK